MADFTIVSVGGNVRDWDSKYGPMKSYRVTLDGPNGEVAGVELSQKASSPVPMMGDKLAGHVETTDYGPKFRKDKVQGSFGGGGPRPRDPEVESRIVRQHSQNMALQYAAIRAAQGKLPDDFKLSDLSIIIDWFDRDAFAVKARKPVRDVERPGGSDIPVEMPPPVAVGDGSTVING